MEIHFKETFAFEVAMTVESFEAELGYGVVEMDSLAFEVGGLMDVA